MRTQSAQPCTTFPTDGLIELHVDDGHGCGKEEVIAELLSFLSEKIEINCVQGIRHGSYEYLKTMKVREKRKLTSISNKRYLQSAMDMLGMSDCKWIGSPKLDKANMEDDNEKLDEDQTGRFRSSVLTRLYLSNERTDIQSTVRHLCTKLQSPAALEMRQLKRLLSNVKGTEDMATEFEVRDDSDRRVTTVKKLQVFTDSDWACDQVTRKSTSGAVIMAEGMRLHAHSRGQAAVALSSCEAEVVAASEGIKEALLLQEVLMFAGMGHYVIEVKVDSSSALAFFHRRGVGPMKHIDSRVLWLQDLMAAGGVKLKKMPRAQNCADMLTQTPSTKELEMFFFPLMGPRCCSDRVKDLVLTKQYKPAAAKTVMVNSRTVQGFHSVVHPSRRSQPLRTTVCVLHLRSRLDSGSGVWGPQSVEYQSCTFAMFLQYWSRDWLRSNICAIFCCRHPFDTEISILNSFLYPEVSCINVLCSGSYSQSI